MERLKECKHHNYEQRPRKKKNAFNSCDTPSHTGRSSPTFVTVAQVKDSERDPGNLTLYMGLQLRRKEREWNGKGCIAHERDAHQVEKSDPPPLKGL
jgi:hypothetical protein